MDYRTTTSARGIGSVGEDVGVAAAHQTLHQGQARKGDGDNGGQV